MRCKSTGPILLLVAAGVSGTSSPADGLRRDAPAELREQTPGRASHDIFTRGLQEQLRSEGRAGLGGQLDRVGTDIVISFVVPVNQSNPAFGQGNRNLSGSALATGGGLRVVRAEATIPYRMDAAKAAATPRLGQWDALVVGQTYRLSRQTPLMPALNPIDPMAGVGAMRQIPAGGLITVKETAEKGGANWYRVEARGVTEPIGKGWVNGVALMTQELLITGPR